MTIIVGAEYEKRLIHKALLLHHSEYLREALSGPWKEAEEKLLDPVTKQWIESPKDVEMVKSMKT